MSDIRVTVCIVSRDENPRREAFEYVSRACEHAASLGIDSSYGFASSGHAVDHARNRAVAGVMAADPRPTHILMVDDDVLIPEDTIPRLLDCGADIAGGCYPGMKRVFTEHTRLSPCVLIRQGKAWAATWFEGIIDAVAVAGGCMLIRTEVMDGVGFPWFRWPQTLNGDVVEHKSDDVDFCYRAAEAGFSIKAHGNVRCSHLKELDLSLFISQPFDRPFVPKWLGPQTVARQKAFPDYGSHIPVLRAVGKHLNGSARRVVEYGCGKYSTPVFCDREYYQHCESVVSYESDHRWLGMVQGEIDDDRLTMYLTPMDRMSGCVDADADVVLIDCGNSIGADKFLSRRELIEAYSKTDRPVVIVHDSNFKGIAPAVEASPYKYKTEYTPQFGPRTALLSNSVDVSQIKIVG